MGTSLGASSAAFFAVQDRSHREVEASAQLRAGAGCGAAGVQHRALRYARRAFGLLQAGFHVSLWRAMIAALAGTFACTASPISLPDASIETDSGPASDAAMGDGGGTDAASIDAGEPPDCGAGPAGAEILACGVSWPTAVVPTGGGVFWTTGIGELFFAAAAGRADRLVSKSPARFFSLSRTASGVAWRSDTGEIGEWIEGRSRVVVRQALPTDLASDDGMLCWSSYTGEVGCRMPDGRIATVVSGEGPIDRIDVESGEVYWLVSAAGPVVHLRSKAVTSTAAARTLSSIAANTSGDLDVTGGFIHWSTSLCSNSAACRRFPTSGCCAGTIHRRARTSSPTVTVAEEPASSIPSLLVAGGTLYWATMTELKRRRGDEAAEVIAVDQGFPTGFAADASHFYWANPKIFSDAIGSEGQVLRIPR